MDTILLLFNRYVMLRENDVVDHLIKSLEVDGYIIKQALYDKQRGIDVIAEKQGSVLYIEVKLL